ncbi:MAG: hypothetical protein JWM11_6150 [Planctomycetaceae bacterium]|nr:hypothetical protein [Planctomycetaceae bacterium]
MSQTAMEREIYESRLKAQRDELTLRNSVERQRAALERVNAEMEKANAEIVKTHAEMAEFNSKIETVDAIIQRQIARQGPVASLPDLLKMSHEQLIQMLNRLG